MGVCGEVAYVDGGTRQVTVTGDRSTRRIAVDGHGPLRAAEAVGTALTVLLAPGDLQMVVGPPAERRRETGDSPVLLLDDVLAEVDPNRSRAMPPCLGTHRQRFVTSARPLRELAGELERWKVCDRRIMAPAVAA